MREKVVPGLPVIRERIAFEVERLTGVAAAEVLTNRPFLELDAGFDSLAVLELQIAIEEAFKFEFDKSGVSLDSLPSGVDEFAAVVQKHLDIFHQRTAPQGS